MSSSFTRNHRHAFCNHPVYKSNKRAHACVCLSTKAEAVAAAAGKRGASARATSVRTGTPPQQLAWRQRRIVVRYRCRRRARLATRVQARAAGTKDSLVIRSGIAPRPVLRYTRAVWSVGLFTTRTRCRGSRVSYRCGARTAIGTRARVCVCRRHVVGSGVRATNRVQAEDVRQSGGRIGQTVPERMGRRRGRGCGHRRQSVVPGQSCGCRQEPAEDHVPAASRRQLRLVLQSK